MKEISDFDFSRVNETTVNNDEYLYKLLKVEKSFVALKCHNDNCEILQSRRDLYEYKGGFSWGIDYKGSGPTFLAVSLLADYYERKCELTSLKDNDIEKLLNKLLCTFDGEKSHIVNIKDIEYILQ